MTESLIYKVHIIIVLLCVSNIFTTTNYHSILYCFNISNEPFTLHVIVLHGLQATPSATPIIYLPHTQFLASSLKLLQIRSFLHSNPGWLADHAIFQSVPPTQRRLFKFNHFYLILNIGLNLKINK